MSYLLSTDILEIGSEYTFNFNTGRLVDFNTPEFVQDKLNSLMINYGDIVDVKKALLQDSYSVVIIPKIKTMVNDFINAFKYSFSSIGYSVSFSNAVGGVNLPETNPILIATGAVGSTVGSVAGTTASSTISGMLQGLSKSPIAIGIIALVAIIFITKK